MKKRVDPLFAELKWYSPNLVYQVRERMHFYMAWGFVMGFGVGVLLAVVVGVLK